MLYRLSYFRKACYCKCGQRWIRTTEGVSQQIYSLPHLATLVFAHISKPLCVVFSRSILETAAKVGIFFIAPNVLQFFLEEKLKNRADACRQVLLRAVFVAGLPFLACADLPTPLLVILYGVMLSGSGRNIRLTLAVFFSILSFYLVEP